jgi:hypothetical protein
MQGVARVRKTTRRGCGMKDPELIPIHKTILGRAIGWRKRAKWPVRAGRPLERIRIVSLSIAII